MIGLLNDDGTEDENELVINLTMNLFLYVWEENAFGFTVFLKR